MADEKNSVAKEIAKDAYIDLVHPAAHATGELVGLVPRAVKAALQPLEKWILEREYNLAETQKLLEEKLKNVKPENITSPEAYVAVPALQYISYCMDNEELRNMYANLLANSMNKVVKNGVHPAFVEIIRQLCPDEAKILKVIAAEKFIPTITLRAEDKNGVGADIARDFSNIMEKANCENFTAYNQYFDNLIRLGLLEHGGQYQQLMPNEKYQELENHPVFLRTKELILNRGNNYSVLDMRKSYLSITSFGSAFCKVCLDNPNESEVR